MHQGWGRVYDFSELAGQPLITRNVMATLITRELHIAESLQHRRLHRFKIGSRSLLLHHEPLPRLQEEFELPHISRGCETTRVALGR